MATTDDTGYQIDVGGLDPGLEFKYVAWIHAVVLQSGGTPTGYTLNYLSNSGIYALPAPGTTADNSQMMEFAVAARDNPGSLPQRCFPFDPGDTAESFRLNKPCYVLLHLEGEWAYSRGNSGVTMRSQQLAWYADLYEVPPADPSGAAAPPFPINRPDGIRSADCQMVFFTAVVHKLPHPLINRFNIFVRNLSSPSFTAIAVDPEIKNDGGEPNWP
ncbi:MAG TPA: hypothetical protein VGF56_01490 [Rhizomicrobium sp.]|jgi:hypothetical protein